MAGRVGRPNASYAIPRLWHHVEALGHYPSHRALITLRWAHPEQVPRGIGLTNRFFEKNFKPECLRLTDYLATSAIIEILNIANRVKRLPELSAPKEMVRFNGRVVGSGEFFGNRGSYDLNNIAIKTGVPRSVIESAVKGRLLPEKICHHIVKLGGLNGAAVISVSPGREATPITDSDQLNFVLSWLADKQ